MRTIISKVTSSLHLNNFLYGPRIFDYGIVCGYSWRLSQYACQLIWFYTYYIPLTGKVANVDSFSSVNSVITHKSCRKNNKNHRLQKIRECQVQLQIYKYIIGNMNYYYCNRNSLTPKTTHLWVVIKYRTKPHTFVSKIHTLIYTIMYNLLCIIYIYSKIKIIYNLYITSWPSAQCCPLKMQTTFDSNF